MKLLGIESSCEVVTVAVCDGERLEVRAVDGGATPSETLIPVIFDLLTTVGLELSGLDALVLGVGPGAFTGLRLGCSVAQGLALAADLRILPVCSLDAIALDQARPRVLVATDARMGETYHACYARHGDDVQPLAPPACVPPEQVSTPPGQWWGAGSAFRAHADRLLVDCADVAGRIGDAVPRADALLRLARVRGLDGALDAAQVAPLYVRDKVALTTTERLARGGKA